MKPSIPEAMDQAAQLLSQKNGNRPLTKKEIIDETLKQGNPTWSRTSVMPDDFCYNRKNKGSRPDDLCIFVTLNPEKNGGPYEYKGKNYVHTGPVFKTWA
jgi:hypothetical protein